jgi:hypothetical protein
MIPAYLHSLSPVSVLVPDYEWLGQVTQPAWYGDGQNYWTPDFIAVFGALGRYDDLTGNERRRDTFRWIQTYRAPGGSEMGVPARVADVEDYNRAILYYMLFDPAATEWPDPHADLPLAHFAEGLGRLLVRTGWDEDASWFTYALGWIAVDHQHGDGNQFEFYRKGEWLTKERTGYGFHIGSSDYHNTLSLENDAPDHNDPDDYRSIYHDRGSQWSPGASGDPTILAMSTGDEYVYALGDATNLYNTAYDNAVDIEHASRSIVWLKPDHIFVYDRAMSKTEGRFKRFWLNLTAEATPGGNRTTVTTPKGQQFAIATLLPADAEISVEPAEALEENREPAIGDPITHRLRVEAPGGPSSVRFLHVLQGADAGAELDQAVSIESSGATAFAGAAAGTTAVLFPVDLGVELEELTYRAPESAVLHLITGLTAGSGYDVETSAESGEISVTVRPGSAETAGDDGVLVLKIAG